MAECCKTGFNWTGSPSGSETTLGDSKTYKTGSNSDRAILIVHDVFGWKFDNLRILADHYAKEADATVYLPDFFGGEVVDPDTLENPEKAKNFDLMAFIGRNSKEIRQPEIFAAAKALRSQYKKVGAIGFCYGGWAVFQLGAKGRSLVDCISTAHPSLLEKDEVKNVAVPVQLLAPEQDPMFSQELKDYCNATIPTLGVEYQYDFYPGVAHGFATKGNQKDKTQKEALERAKRSAVGWFVQHLHEVK